MKTFNGKAIYNPSGKAGEYSYWACNFYVGCSNDCSYCYCKKGILGHTMGSTTPTLKKCFRDEAHALEIFQKELKSNLPELQKHGLFFSFTTDPMLIETISLTQMAIITCVWNKVPVKILTKRADFLIHPFFNVFLQTNIWMDHYKMSGLEARKYIAFGFTLTGHDEVEPNASTNFERIEAMAKLHEAGFKTWASIEPVIDFESSYEMICQTAGYCDLYKIGLMSGQKVDKFYYGKLRSFCLLVGNRLAHFPAKIYWKDSILKAAGIDRDSLPANCVGRDYNIFNK